MVRHSRSFSSASAGFFCESSIDPRTASAEAWAGELGFWSNRRPASVGAAGEPVGDGQLVAAVGRVGVVDSLHGFPQCQRTLVLLDRPRRFSQVQVGQAQHLADGASASGRSANASATCDSAASTALAQCHVLILAPGPEGIR